jgi:hypothetical protein
VSEEHPFEIACKLARALEEMKELHRLRACVKALQALQPEPVVARPALPVREPSHLDRVHARFNGTPIHLDDLIKHFPDMTHIRLQNICFKLQRNGRLRRVGRSTFQKA